jgi:hypothetical protein
MNFFTYIILLSITISVAFAIFIGDASVDQKLLSGLAKLGEGFLEGMNIVEV